MTTPLPAAITQRLEKVEKLLASLTQEFNQLKEALQPLPPPPQVPKPKTTPSIYEEFKKNQPWEDLLEDINLGKETIVAESSLYEDINLGKETIVAESSLYEELNDLEDWEEIKRELQTDKETIIADYPVSKSKKPQTDEEEEFNPFKSMSDPW